MNVLRRMLIRLRNPDAGLLRNLRRFMSIAILSYGLLAFLLLVLYFLASTAPHPLTLFLGDLVLIIPLLFRIITLAFLVLLNGAMIMRAALSLRLRNTRR